MKSGYRVVLDMRLEELEGKVLLISTSQCEFVDRSALATLIGANLTKSNLNRSALDGEDLKSERSYRSQSRRSEVSWHSRLATP